MEQQGFPTESRENQKNNVFREQYNCWFDITQKCKFESSFLEAAFINTFKEPLKA